ncbi:HAD superfamily hydrolase (TIGR01450 family) [Branchiibius hedensis]|uniref:Haloacid Dehalogenase Superfamily Class (Subfamily) IIA n=1 Tax=Branchiibius hedensis TaxID=672460 RepID=A0A2Y8ZVB2_9MICO|nr:HAD-IIA family hydrolase [Branchiibius hedensis]PWJ25446.1 HAD superfamily hydrolase (TIGR01450 family) [Branchiibius hedensis]SSA34259.1 Haloacid Dehalogenase Superfamily Class (subfamily) IIA [Branchiibius hedensis]
MTASAPGLLLDRVDTAVFDLDGTVYLGDALLPGAQRTIHALRASGKRTVFCSNNPTKTALEYAEKLTRLGVPTDPADVVTSLTATVRWVQDNAAGAKVFAIGEAPLESALTDAGVELSDDPEQIDVVIASYDRAFDYRKLQIAFDALWFHKRARLVATNPDRFCPFPGGRGEPDAASVIAAIEACAQVRCEAVFGKPEQGLLDIMISLTGLHPESTVMLGDRLATDIRFANRGGMTSALVLTGETDRALLARNGADDPPDVVLDRIDELLTICG